MPQSRSESRNMSCTDLSFTHCSCMKPRDHCLAIGASCLRPGIIADTMNTRADVCRRDAKLAAASKRPFQDSWRKVHACLSMRANAARWGGLLVAPAAFKQALAKCACGQLAAPDSARHTDMQSLEERLPVGSGRRRGARWPSS